MSLWRDIRTFVKVPWKTWAFTFLLVGAAIFLWNREKRLRFSAQTEAEAARLALHNQIVENESTRGQLQHSLGALLAENESLRAAYDQAREAAPDAKPASVSRLDTGPLPVRWSPSPETPRGTTPRTPVASPAAETGGVPPTPTPSAAGPICIITVADQVSVTVEQVELQTKAGNTLIVGTAAAYLEPVHQVFAAGRFRSQLSTSASLETPKPPRWGALALGVCNVGGCGLGAGVLLPAFTLPWLGWRVESLAAVAAPRGDVQALVGVGVRW